MERKSSFTEIFIKRPVLAIVINVIICLTGIVSLSQLSLREYPKINYPTITVSTQYPDASAQVVEEQITRILEESYSAISGLNYIESVSSGGESNIYLNFDPNININEALVDIMEKTIQARQGLPRGLRDSTFSKQGINDNTLMRICAYSDKMELGQITDNIERYLKPSIETISGVASINISGTSGGLDSGSYQIHTIVSPEMLKKYDITFQDIRDAVYSSRLMKPLGKIIKNDIEHTITLNQSAQGIEDYKNIIIKSTDNGIVKLKDIAEIKIISSDPNSKVSYNGKPCVFITVNAEQNANPIETAKKIEKKVKELQATISKNIKIEIFTNSSTNIKKSINAVYKTIFEAIIFVFLVLMFFLRSFRSTIIPIIAIPISLLGGIFILFMCNFSLNLLTLLAMVIAVGLVVDDAIVVLENIHKHIENGLSPYEAAVKGTAEIQFSIIAMTLTLFAVYAPIAFLSGMIGKLFLEFAITLAGTVLISGIVALVLTPMLCAKLLKKEHDEYEWQKKSVQILDSVDQYYKHYLEIALKNIQKVLIGSAIFGFIGFSSAYFIPKYLTPQTDQSLIGLSLEGPSGSMVEYVEYYAKKIEDQLINIKEIQSQLTFLNSGGKNNIYIKLNDPEKRKKSCEILLNEITKEAFKVQSGLSVNGHCFSSGIVSSEESGNVCSFTIQTQQSYDNMESIVKSVFEILKKHPGVKFETLKTSKVEKEKAYEVKIDEEKAAMMNVRINDIAETLTMIMRGQPPLDRFQYNGKTYPMRAMVSKEFRFDAENIKNFYIRAHKASKKNNRKAELVPLKDLLIITSKEERVAAHRYEGMRSYKILVETKNGYTPLKVYNDISKELNKILPSGYKHSPVDTLRKTVSENSNIMLLFILALLFIFLIMAAQFESFIDPLIIMLSVPFAIAGGLISILIMPNASLNIFTYISLITLIGLISKHGILIVDFANKIFEEERFKNEKTLMEAIQKASLLRLRPILMTTFAMFLGALPLAISTGVGYEIRSQIGIVLVGGITIGTFFTLFVIPCSYFVIKNLVMQYQMKK